MMEAEKTAIRIGLYNHHAQFGSIRLDKPVKTLFLDRRLNVHIVNDMQAISEFHVA